MKTVLYADVLFLINFGMDLISLWLTFIISKRSVSPFRLITAASLGGAYGVASVVFDVKGAASFIFSALVSFAMVAISVLPGLKFRSVVKYSFILWGIGALIGGVVTVICTLGDTGGADLASHNAPFFVFALGGAGAYGLVKLISKVSSVKSCRAVVSMFGVDAELEMLVDTGCLVKEPISGADVIFIARRALDSIHNRDVGFLCGGVENTVRLSHETKRRARVVTVKRAGDERALISFFPDGVILIIKNERKPVKCAVVIEDTADYGGYDGIVPASLVR